jgi:hypothetical protein
VTIAWEQLGVVRGRVMASDEMRERVELAEARLPLIRKLQAIPETADETEQENRVLEIWDESLLNDCHDASPWQWIYDRASTGKKALQSIDEAIEAENLAEAERLLKEPCMEDLQLPNELAAKLEELRGRAQKATLAKRQAIVSTLLNNDRPAFVELFDAALLGDICRQFRHHQPVVSQWIEAEILPISRIGFSADPENALVRDEKGNLKITWTWPPPDITSQCRLLICKNRPPAHCLPEDIDSQYSVGIQRHEWDEAAGHQVAVDPEWEGSSVYVWAVIDLGFQTFYSEPFKVGQIEPIEVKHRRWGLFRSRKGEKPAKAGEEGKKEKADEVEEKEATAAQPQEPAGGDEPTDTESNDQ